MMKSPTRSSRAPLPYLSPHASPNKSAKQWTPLFVRNNIMEPDTNLYISKSRRQDGIQWNWIALIYTIAAFSTLTARWCVNLEDRIDALERRSLVVTAQRDHLRDDLGTLDDYIFDEQRTLRQLKKTRKALEHEIQVVSEYKEETGRSQFVQPQTDDSIISSNKTSKHQKTIQTWLATRHDNLVHRIRHLQSYLQRMSYTSVTRKFGTGPHRVQFTIDMQNRHGKRSIEAIEIETVPSQDMPASIHMFLDTIDAGTIWDNSMFIHHGEDLDHVVPAAPVDFETHQVRRTLLGSLGWADLGFPEYNPKYPHDKYTVGFAGKGPTFYINTVDNSVDHGPGGQDHHLLPEDADPCFGKIVVGQQVVDDLVTYGNLQTKMAQDADHPWADEGHRSTRIVSAKILPPKGYVES